MVSVPSGAIVDANGFLTPAWLTFINKLDKIARTNVLTVNSPSMQAFIDRLAEHELTLDQLIVDQELAAARLDEIDDLNIVRMEIFPVGVTGTTFECEYDFTMCDFLVGTLSYLGEGGHTTGSSNWTVAEFTKLRFSLTGIAGDADLDGACFCFFGFNLTEDRR